MSELNIEQARFNMIEQQIRPWDVLDQRVLDTLARIPREEFVPQRYRNLAFADIAIPLGHEQVMMHPNVEGRVLQALQIQPQDRVLEIGTGSGYLTACLAQLGNQVLSVDIIAQFTETAAQRLRDHGVHNVQLQTGDAAQDWGHESYDVIVLTGSLPELPSSWLQRLAVGGRLFVIVGTEPIMEAGLVVRSSEQEWLSESLFETAIPPLLNSMKTVEFNF